jgi:hypothetical protein
MAGCAVRYFSSASYVMAKSRKPYCETWYKHDDDADLGGYVGQMEGIEYVLM